MTTNLDPRLRIAAISFLNPAPLMWDLEHPAPDGGLRDRYQIEWMLPAECADRLAAGTADLGLVPIAALAGNPGLRVVPGCTIASKDRVRSLLLVRRADQPLHSIRTVAADTASRTTVTYTKVLFHKWGNPEVRFLPMAADLAAMLQKADAAIIIGDPALFALETKDAFEQEHGQALVYHDLAHEWRSLTGLPFVSAVWAATSTCGPLDTVAEDMIRSRDHGLAHIEDLADEWSQRLPLRKDIIRTYLTENIHYVLDEECLEGIRGFFRMAAETGVLPRYDFSLALAAV